MQKVVIFGVGKYGKRTLTILNNHFSRIVECIIDNKQWGFTLNDVPVVQAGDFLKGDKRKQYTYIVSGKYCNEMQKQLLDADIPSQQIYSLEQYIVENTEYEKIADEYIDKATGETCIIFDCPSGFVLGGVEQWTYLLASQLKKRGHHVKLHTNYVGMPEQEDLKEDVLYMPITDDAVLQDGVKSLKQALVEYEHVTFVLGKCNMFAAAVMGLKKLHPSKVRIISVIHSSLSYIVEENVRMKRYIDYFWCVNSSVQEEFQRRLTRAERVYFKPSPVEYLVKDRTYNLNQKEPIEIGYAARLEIDHKRVDLIPALIDELEALDCVYKFSIAGDGEYFIKLSQYIEERQLKEKVFLLGNVPHESMYEFWQEQDIAINVSETEGCSLSMLEAMACGCVYMATYTRGAEWFVKDGENGYLVEIGNMVELAERIKYLEEHRCLIQKLGDKSRKIIEENCNTDRYVGSFEKLINK